MSYLTEFLAGVIGVVEATSFEKHCLWQQEHQERGRQWKQNLSGYIPQIGELDGRPICVSLFTAVVDDHKILFIEATSQLVDHRMIEEWLKKNLPASALKDDGKHINHVNASNFHNVFPR